LGSPRSPLLHAVAAALLLAAAPGALASGDPGEPAPAAPAPRPDAPPVEATTEAWAPTFLFESGAYYTSAGVYVPLTGEPIPNVGERGEVDIYWVLLPRSPVPRFAVLEASVNPMPCLGLAIRDRERSFYDRAQIDASTNLVRAITAGFEEPWAASLFLGNVVDFDARGSKDTKGKGYFGLVLSAGNLHIKENVAIRDPWLETELKLKGDRKSPVKKLSWSFRVGVKLHANHDIVNEAYVGIRRSRVDYQDAPWYVANSGVEYRLDTALDGTPLRHLFLVDKKWPLLSVAPSIAIGLLWEVGDTYTGALAVNHTKRLQLLVRPNVEF
jgi:hypothetical protein